MHGTCSGVQKIVHAMQVGHQLAVHKSCMNKQHKVKQELGGHCSSIHLHAGGHACMKYIECVSATHAFPMIRRKTSLVTPGTHKRPSSNTKTALPAHHTCVWSCYSCWPCVFSDDILGSTAVSKKKLLLAEACHHECTHNYCQKRQISQFLTWYWHIMNFITKPKISEKNRL